jgi:nicotinamidase-related amidase
MGTPELRVRREDTLLLVIDVQERLAPAMAPERLGRMLKNLERLGAARELLGLPAVVTEQYPKGLGATVPLVQAAFAGIPVQDKLAFSACGDPAIRSAIEGHGKGTVVVAGMETHVCVWQTVRHLLADGRSVHVLADAVASRTEENYQIGLGLMARAGAVITSTEVVLFDMLEAAGTEAFKGVSRLVK